MISTFLSIQDQGRPVALGPPLTVGVLIWRRPLLDSGPTLRMLGAMIMSNVVAAGREQSDLFQPAKVGPCVLTNRVVMAPLTRSRAGSDGIPRPLMVEYYEQWSSAGLIIAEGTNISPQGRGYAFTPGIYSEPQGVSTYADEVPVPSFGPRPRCERCRHLVADASPNWNEMHKQEPITRSSSESKIRA